MKEVTVVIPIYKNTLSDQEMRSLLQAYTVLHAYPIVVAKPESLDLSPLLTDFPEIKSISFADTFFQGIDGYNQLMLSSLFYERFFDSRYILIYQLDAYVFVDELSDWCAKDYDYIGAPWLERPIYRLPLIAAYRRWQHASRLAAGKHSEQSLYNKVGNGGFSLRKVDSHLRAIATHREKIDFFLEQKRTHFHNEDVFWATEVPEFRFPDSREALDFSFDKYPSLCYKLNDNRLPFGCHGWYKRKMRGFWKSFI